MSRWRAGSSVVTAVHVNISQHLASHWAGLNSVLSQKNKKNISSFYHLGNSSEIHESNIFQMIEFSLSILTYDKKNIQQKICGKNLDAYLHDITVS